MKARLLHPDRDHNLTAELPANAEDLVRDLELRSLVAAMAAHDDFLADVCLRMLLSSLVDPETILYRQAILEDFLDQPALLRELYGEVVVTLAARSRIWSYSSSFRSPRSVLLGARECLQMFVDRLRMIRILADRYRKSVGSEGLHNLFASMQEDLSDDYLHDVSRHLEQIQFPEGLLLSAQLATDNTGDNYVLRVPERDRPGWRERLGLSPRTVYSFNVRPQDGAGVQALEALWSRGLNEVANPAAQSADHISDYFAMLRVELGFYLGCVNLAERLSTNHQSFCMPKVSASGSGALGFDDLRDPRLILKSTEAVVGNNAAADGKTLVVITGANSGGKTTFLRSIGVAQLMAQAGMFVTAQSYRAAAVSGIFTHFGRKEDATMTRGRLEEELARVSELAKQITAGALVLFDESFHSTNEVEGSEIARQIVQALRDSGNRVVFVSHLYDFARGLFGEGPTSPLFVRAELGANGRPDYRFAPAAPVATAYGPELYRQIFADEPG